MEFKGTSLEEIRAYVENNSDDAQCYKEEITDRLASLCWDIGLIWDKLEGIDPDKGGPKRFGTPNKKSRTYKMRKVAGYTYP